MEKMVLTQEQAHRAASELFELMTPLGVLQCLHTVASLGVADVLGSRTMNAEEISKELPGKVRPEALQRCLRLLASKGLLIETKAGDGVGVGCFAYSLTSTTALLQTGVPDQPSFAPIVMHNLEKPSWGAWGEVSNYVAGVIDESPFKAYNGDDVFDFYARTPVSEGYFHEAMKMFSSFELPFILESGGWGELSGKRVVDCGGSKGAVMGAVKAKFPEVTCTTFDLPEIIAKAGLPPEGVTFAPGDIFNASTIPEADVFFMKMFVHDFDDQDATKILKNCHARLPVGGQVLLAEAVLPDPGGAAPGRPRQQVIYMDMHMMTIHGRQRTRAQFVALAEAAGLRLIKFQEGPKLCFVTMEKKA